MLKVEVLADKSKKPKNKPIIGIATCNFPSLSWEFPKIETKHIIAFINMKKKAT